MLGSDVFREAIFHIIIWFLWCMKRRLDGGYDRF
jgi:hypothetical protein